MIVLFFDPFGLPYSLIKVGLCFPEARGSLTVFMFTLWRHPSRFIFTKTRGKTLFGYLYDVRRVSRPIQFEGRA